MGGVVGWSTRLSWWCFWRSFTSPGGGLLGSLGFPVLCAFVVRAVLALLCVVCLWGLCWWRPWWCVLCARGRVCGVLVVRLGACPRLSGLGLAALCGCGGCVSRSLACPGCGDWVWFPATPGWGLLVAVCSPAAPFACPPPSFFWLLRLACCPPGALSGTTRVVVGVRWGWVGGGSLTLARVPSLGVSPWGGRCLHSLSWCNSVVRAVHL